MLANQIREITPKYLLDYTTLYIERAKESYNTMIPIMAKFSDWSRTKSHRTAFIEAVEKQNTKQPTNLCLTNVLKSLWI